MNKPIAKSLHTVTVLVAIKAYAQGSSFYAEYFRDMYNGHAPSVIMLEQAVDYAVHVLSLAGFPDVYCLKDQAVLSLHKTATKLARGNV